MKYQQDPDGVVSCRYRTSHPRDPGSNNWCALIKELCCYNANCRVPIPTNLSVMTQAARELVVASEDVVEIMLDHGMDCPGSYHDAFVAVQKAQADVRALLKLEDNDAEQK